MIERLQQKRRTEGGFTLVELLVVIVILGILAAIVVFAVGGVKDKGQESACKADVSSISSAEEAHFATKGSYVAMGALVSAGFLHASSEMHNVTPVAATASAEATYTIAPIPGEGCAPATP